MTKWLVENDVQLPLPFSYYRLLELEGVNTIYDNIAHHEHKQQSLSRAK